MVLWPTAAARHGFTMISFTEAVSCQNTFVGGTCAPPIALLVSVEFMFLSSASSLLSLACQLLTSLPVAD